MLSYLKMTPKTKQDFENDPQQNGRLPLTGNKRQAPLKEKRMAHNHKHFITLS